MRFDRSSGILLHISSLPNAGGIGDLGPAARRFVEFLQQTRQRWWQMLPIGPTGFANSPYQSTSSFAGNPLFVSPEEFVTEGLLTAAELKTLPTTSRMRVEYDAIGSARMDLLSRAFQRFNRMADTKALAEFQQFRTEQAWWLDDFVFFTALKKAHHDQAWMNWAPDLVRRDPEALRDWSSRLKLQIDLEAFIQFQFARQWRALQEFARDRGVQFIGDVPIFVAHDSADVWAHQDLFLLDQHGQPLVMAGVPPDYFSTSGQLWGNPLYDWKKHASRGFDWWISRLQQGFRRFDVLRIDHFRGFESHWEIPAGSPDARRGRWVAGPRQEVFQAAEAALGPLPVIAEDLGVITPEVEKLRDDCGFPGMRVLQFAFGDDPKSVDYQPHNFPRHCVVFTGTHDNDTTVGWFHSQAGDATTRTAEQVQREQTRTLDYLGTDGSAIHWDLIRLAWLSVADVAMVPLQDVLGLDTSARMNRPGTAVGNWEWRYLEEWLTPQVIKKLALLTEIYGRASSASLEGATISRA